MNRKLVSRSSIGVVAGGALLFAHAAAFGQALPVDLTGVKAGPVRVSANDALLTVAWKDGAAHAWRAQFSLASGKPLIASITEDGRVIVEKADPVYRVMTGKRKGGWDAFFDFPPANPEGTRRFLQEFHPRAVTAKTVGDRVEIAFDGMQAGIFRGEMQYWFYPGSALIQQVALMKTDEPDTAYSYDAGLVMSSDADRRPGINMASTVVYYDAAGVKREETSPYGSERHTLRVRYRAVAAKMGQGSVVAFPAPHRYLFARDYTTNMGYAWYSAWRGKVGLGIQQPADDNTGIYPWMNAPPGTEQEMGIFFLLGGGEPAETLDKVLAYTHGDRFAHVDGFVTFAPHWHFAFTEQAVANVPGWVPPFKTELEKAGVDAAMIMDFHIDGHPQDTGALRLKEIQQYYAECRRQSDGKFLLIPAEEADVYLGGHWGLVFPKQVNWIMTRKPGEAFKTGDVYRVGTAEDMWRLVEAEKGYAYQTHPRTKGSTGYPDKVLGADYFRSPRYVGVGWKAMPSDLSSPRLGERGFKTLDDVNNLGLKKIMLGEVDVFQITHEDELYSAMNVNYLPMDRVPGFDRYGDLVDTAVKGRGFISTGEVLLPKVSIMGGEVLSVKATVGSTFPLRMAEVVWGDGRGTHREVFDLSSSREFASKDYAWTIQAKGWTWARLAVWDIAGDGGFTNPVWR